MRLINSVAFALRYVTSTATVTPWFQPKNKKKIILETPLAMNVALGALLSLSI